ncbi:energy transducer TonB [Hymenobacter sp. BT491]|uniref:energy transducer TonB n=1 Tax=Hymenobacter sp. BT491 TaxID=2766779 RepID=UPI0016534F2B|nr:energy transducer TonB [Hymenobacter sp. BT491]MBC6991314.1 energy transducer TonB [Hymenobacter sp. BT491]
MKKHVLIFLLLLLPALCWAQRVRKTEWESGTLEKGDKVGVWEYYGYTRDGSQVILQKYDHTTKKLLFFRPIEDIFYDVELQPGQWTKSRVDQPPMFIGSDPALATYTAKLNYPLAAQDRKLQGKVIVSFAIDTLGQISNHKVVAGVGGGCDEEALRVSRTIPNQWIPARKNGRAVPVVYEMPFVFRLK